MAGKASNAKNQKQQQAMKDRGTRSADRTDRNVNSPKTTRGRKRSAGKK